jgi:hypothetical protein
MIVVRKASASRNMLGLAKSPSTRIVCNRLLGLRLVVLALLGSLVITASARAEGPTGETPAVATAEEASGAPTSGTEASGGTAPPTTEASSQASPETTTPPPASEGSTEGVSTPPPAEEKAAEVTAPPPVEEKAAEVTAPPPAEEKAPEVVAPPPAEEKAPEVIVPPVVEEAKEVVKPLVGTEETPSILSTHTVTEEAPAGSLSTPSPPPGTATSAEGELASGIATALSNSAVPPAPPSEPGEPPASSTQAAFGALSRMAVSQRPGGLSCALSALEGPMTGNCAAGWLAAPSLLPTQPASLSTATSPWTATTAGAPAEGGHGGSGAGSRPSNPAPGPAPGGASGGSAAGGSGLALSAFLTLAGLLMLSAPRALCRLRLACRPWLTAFFVLIPERPG